MDSPWQKGWVQAGLSVLTQRFALTLPASILPARDFFTTQSANAMKKATHRSDKLGLSLDGFETTQDRYIFSRDSISLICRFGTNGEWVDWVQVERAGCIPVAGENVMAQRGVLCRHWEVPMAEAQG